VRFEVRRVDHQMLRAGDLFCQGDEGPAKDTEAAPPDEAIIQSLVRAIRLRSVFPLLTGQAAIASSWTCKAPKQNRKADILSDVIF
jgi:hypothetical protein